MAKIIKIKKIKNWEARPFTESITTDKKGNTIIVRYVKKKKK